MSTPHIDEAKGILAGVEFVDEPARLAACVVVSIALQKARAEITRLSGEVAEARGLLVECVRGPEYALTRGLHARVTAFLKPALATTPVPPGAPDPLTKEPRT